MLKRKIAPVLAVLMMLLMTVPVYAADAPVVASASGLPGTGYIVGAIVGGFIIALIVTGVMKGKLKSVHMARNANNYIREGSMKITGQSDIFLFVNVTKTPRPQNNEKK